MSRNTKLSLSAIFAALLITCGVAAQQSGNPMSPSSGSGAGAAKTSGGIAAADARFMKEAAAGGMAEVALGQLAVEKASSGDVKKFGQRMVDDHGKANDELKQLASEKHVDLPQGLNAKDKATKSALEKLSGEQFDQAYVNDMVKDHKKDISDFRRESKTAQDSDVKNFAAQTLPTLEEHLKQAESIAQPGSTASAAH